MRKLIRETCREYAQEVIVEFAGWVANKRDHGKLTFIDLRDHTGILQVVGRGLLRDLSIGDVVCVKGTLKRRPENMVNLDVPCGGFEMAAESCQIVNHSKPLPVPTDGPGYEINEESRLKYRYIDLRRERLQKNIRLRSEFFAGLRLALGKYDFIEIETPLLTKSTKEGARDFIVPSRTHPGQCYALPQSPQQYKQLLMVAGFEKYYQFARCVRDEDPRADRGFEFTQLDLEMAFVTHEREILWRVEQMLLFALGKIRITWNQGVTNENADWREHCRFPVFTYAEAMSKFGNDKPDLRTAAEKESNTLAFCWIVRFPLFKPVKESVDRLDSKSEWTFMHNPFSAPVPEHAEQLLKGEDVGSILGCQYDLVCNGCEIGSGSIRSFQSEYLRATFKVMGYSEEQVHESVGHMLEAFDLGAPPHAGIALGLDRLVMLICGEPNLKEVIAFPTSISGKTSVMDAPCPIRPEQKKEIGL